MNKKYSSFLIIFFYFFENLKNIHFILEKLKNNFHKYNKDILKC